MLQILCLSLICFKLPGKINRLAAEDRSSSVGDEPAGVDGAAVINFPLLGKITSEML